MLIINYYKINIKLIGTETFNESDKLNDLNEEQAVKAEEINDSNEIRFDYDEIKQFELY